MKREQITKHEEILDYAVTKINDSYKSSGIHVVGLKVQANFNLKLSNSHSCPINGQTNWGGNRVNAPCHYKGWGGRVWLIFNKFPSGFGSMNNSLIHSGTGGYGSYNFGKELSYHQIEGHILKEHRNVYPLSWNCKVFIDDFPKLLATYESNRIEELRIEGEQRIEGLLLRKPRLMNPPKLPSPLSLLYIK